MEEKVPYIKSVSLLRLVHILCWFLKCEPQWSWHVNYYDSIVGESAELLCVCFIRTMLDLLHLWKYAWPIARFIYTEILPVCAGNFVIGTAHIVCRAGSVQLSGVRPIATTAGLVLWARRPGDIDQLLHGRRSAAVAPQHCRQQQMRAVPRCQLMQDTEHRVVSVWWNPRQTEHFL